MLDTAGVLVMQVCLSRCRSGCSPENLLKNGMKFMKYGLDDHAAYLPARSAYRREDVDGECD
jgi:hypothetical protein